MGLSYFLLYTYIFFFGAAIGSFLNVVADRLPLGISVAKGRSFCPHCQQTLRVYDLIPVISYLLLSGRCRNCRARIPVKYLLAELAGGAACVLCFVAFGFSWKAVYACACSFVLLVITLIDFSTLEIPDRLILLLTALALIGLLFADIPLWSRIVGFFIVSLPMLGLTVLIPDCFGGGDIKLIAVSGFLLGFDKTLLAMFMALLIGGSYAAVMLLTKKLQKGQHMAFGPYICAGVYIALLAGRPIIDGYLGFFGL